MLARLEVSLLEARNLPSMKYPKGTSDIMVEVAVELVDIEQLFLKVLVDQEVANQHIQSQLVRIL